MVPIGRAASPDVASSGHRRDGTLPGGARPDARPAELWASLDRPLLDSVRGRLLELTALRRPRQAGSSSLSARRMRALAATLLIFAVASLASSAAGCGSAVPPANASASAATASAQPSTVVAE